MYKYLNLHPKRLLVEDCVKRAIALAANMDYRIVQRELNRYKRVTGAESYNSGYNPHRYIENVLKGEKLVFSAKEGERRMTGGEFCRQYPKGRYVLNMPGHFTACIDGVIYDTWDPSEKIVYTAYKITPATK